MKLFRRFLVASWLLLGSYAVSLALPRLVPWCTAERAIKFTHGLSGISSPTMAIERYFHIGLLPVLSSSIPAAHGPSSAGCTGASYGKYCSPM